MKKAVTAILAGSFLFASLPALADQAGAEQALKNAQAVAHEADAKHYLWTSTEKLLKDANEAMKKNEFDKAEQLAKEAQMEAQLSLKQAELKPVPL